MRRSERPAYEPEDWYQGLKDEVGSTLTETRFNASEALIRGKHGIGLAIVEAGRAQCVAEQELCRELSRELKVSKRTIEQAVQFYRYDPTCSVLSEGKNISWRKILIRMQGKRPPKEPCPHPKDRRKTLEICEDCGDSVTDEE